MATTLTHHHQLQPQHFPHQIPSQTITTQPTLSSPGHLCKDCNMLFESSTSLEVHLSYHKENLLTKWGTSENMDKSHIQNHNTPASPHTNHRVHADVPTTNSSRPPSSSEPSEQHGQHPPHYFPVETHGHYLISQYNNNTGDHHLEPAFRPGATNFGHPPVDTHGHLYGSHNNIHHSPYPPLAPGQNQLFSPNSTQNSNTNGTRTPQPPPPNPNGGPEPPVSRESAEILDLDSHKVHIYQQQQQQLAERNFFHRPYLSHLLPPQPSNGWPHGPPPEHQFVNNHSHSPAAGYTGEHQSLPGGAYPPPSNTNGPRPSIPPYDLGSNDLPNLGYPPEPPTAMGYPPLQHPNQHHLSQSSAPNFGSSIPGAFPPGPPPSTINGDSESNTPSARRTPPEGRGNKSAVKSKGWKGGDAKRPKTYNCTACNKWFTSSGHLKRHYGTTLHKNSIKQKGGVIEETKPPATKSKGGKRSPGDSQQAAGSDSMHSSSSSSPGRMNIKIEDTSSEKSASIYGVPSSAANNNSATNPSSNRSGDVSLNNPNFNPNLNNSPPVPVPSPNSPYNIPGGPAYLPYGTQNSASIPTSNNSNNSQHQPPPPHQYSIPGQQFHPSSSAPYLNGFVSDSANPANGLVPYSIPPIFVPTTIYNGGGNYSNVDGDNTPLPPFSSVGFSHYDPNSFQSLNSSPNNANPSAFPPNPSPNRVTPPYQPHHQHLMGSTPSPATSHNNNESHHSMESVRGNRRGSPDDFRYLPTSGSNEGSLDGVENSEPDRYSPSTSSSSDTNMKEGVESDGDALKCPDCSKTFVRACYLTQHANSSHSGGKPFKCNSCGKRFSAEPALTEHIAKHGEEKPYKCKLCPKQFNHKTDLRRHNCLHTGEKPFVCHICQKGFIRKDHMTKHCETHLKKKGNS